MKKDYPDQQDHPEKKEKKQNLHNNQINQEQLPVLIHSKNLQELSPKKQDINKIEEDSYKFIIINKNEYKTLIDKIGNNIESLNIYSEE